MFSYYLKAILQRYQWFVLRANKNKLYSSADLEDQKSMLFLLSCGRSGSTLLRKELLKRGVAIPPESHDFIPNFLNWFALNKNSAWTKVIDAAVDIFNKSAPTQYWDIDLNEVEQTLLKIPEKEQTIYKIIRTFYFSFIDQHYSSFTLWGDKTPLLSQYLTHIRILFPNARFLFITRQSSKVVASWVKNFGYTISQAKNRYRWTNKEIKNHQSKVGDFPMLTLENFTRCPENRISWLANLLGFENKIINETPYLGDDDTSYHSGLQQSIIPDNSLIKPVPGLDDLFLEIFQKEEIDTNHTTNKT